MPSGPPTTVARCQFCGREIDNRGFQVYLAGARGAFHSADCALRAAAGESVEDLPDRDAPGRVEIVR